MNESTGRSHALQMRDLGFNSGTAWFPKNYCLAVNTLPIPPNLTTVIFNAMITNSKIMWLEKNL